MIFAQMWRVDANHLFLFFGVVIEATSRLTGNAHRLLVARNIGATLRVNVARVVAAVGGVADLFHSPVKTVLQTDAANAPTLAVCAHRGQADGVKLRDAPS